MLEYYTAKSLSEKDSKKLYSEFVDIYNYMYHLRVELASSIEENSIPDFIALMRKKIDNLENIYNNRSK